MWDRHAGQQTNGEWFPITLKVRVIGHTDPTGSVTVNHKLGLKRAEKIRSLLLRAGVDPGQILPIESRERHERLSTSPATHWMDRRVEVLQ